jgi:hypothetical protein
LSHITVVSLIINTNSQAKEVKEEREAREARPPLSRRLPSLVLPRPVFR